MPSHFPFPAFSFGNVLTVLFSKDHRLHAGMWDSWGVWVSTDCMRECETLGGVWVSTECVRPPTQLSQSSLLPSTLINEAGYPHSFFSVCIFPTPISLSLVPSYLYICPSSSPSFTYQSRFRETCIWDIFLLLLFFCDHGAALDFAPFRVCPPIPIVFFRNRQCMVILCLVSMGWVALGAGGTQLNF